jgi:hypothetical protein
MGSCCEVARKTRIAQLSVVIRACDVESLFLPTLIESGAGAGTARIFCLRNKGQLHPRLLTKMR